MSVRYLPTLSVIVKNYLYIEFHIGQPTVGNIEEITIFFFFFIESCLTDNRKTTCEFCTHNNNNNNVLSQRKSRMKSSGLKIIT